MPELIFRTRDFPKMSPSGPSIGCPTAKGRAYAEVKRAAALMLTDRSLANTVTNGSIVRPETFAASPARHRAVRSKLDRIQEIPR